MWLLLYTFFSLLSNEGWLKIAEPRTHQHHHVNGLPGLDAESRLKNPVSLDAVDRSLNMDAYGCDAPGFGDFFFGELSLA